MQYSSILFLFTAILQDFARYGHHFCQELAFTEQPTPRWAMCEVRSGSNPDQASLSWLRGEAICPVSNCHRYSRITNCSATAQGLPRDSRTGVSTNLILCTRVLVHTSTSLKSKHNFIQCKHIVRGGTSPPFHSATSMERFHRSGQAVRRCSYRAVAYSLLQYMLATYCSVQTPAPVLQEEFARMFYMLKPPSAPFARWRAT